MYTLSLCNPLSLQWTESTREFTGCSSDPVGEASARLMMVSVAEGGKIVWPGDGLPDVDDMREFVQLSLQGVLAPMPLGDKVKVPASSSGISAALSVV